jgi:hypothetical protein
MRFACPEESDRLSRFLLRRVILSVRSEAEEKETGDEEKKTTNWRETKRPPGNRAASSLGRIVPTEANKPVKTFCRNLMSRKTGVSSDFS